MGGGSQHGSRVNGIGDSQASRGQEKTLRGGGEGTGDRIDNEDGDLVKVKEGTGCCSVM